MDLNAIAQAIDAEIEKDFILVDDKPNMVVRIVKDGNVIQSYNQQIDLKKLIGEHKKQIENMQNGITSLKADLEKMKALKKEIKNSC